MTTRSPAFDLSRRLAAEGVGAILLLAVVVGSGIMGERLSPDSDAVALMLNAISTGAGLFVLITLLGPVSGAHFNPLVTLSSLASGELERGEVAARITVQVLGAAAGVLLAHAMFDLPLLQVSVKARDGLGQVLSEGVAAFGLMMVVRLGGRLAPPTSAALVSLYITSAYGFTASTAFANPALTLARSLTDTFAGISPGSIPGFLFGQAAGAVAAALASRGLMTPSGANPR